MRKTKKSKKSAQPPSPVAAPPAPRFKLIPRNTAQQAFIQAINQTDLTFGIGPAGTGKTFIAIAMAVRAKLDGQVSKIILTRPVVEAGEKLGFLPGSFQEKLDPYLIPLYDALNEVLPPNRVKTMLEDKTIEIAPLAFMRGRTLKDAFVILDEAQNTTNEQMKMFMTRLGDGSRMVINGDPTQIDLPKHQKSGLIEAQRILKRCRGVSFCTFEAGDVVRHKLVQRIVNCYDADRSGTPVEDVGEE